MLFKETIAVYCENRSKHTHTQCGQNAVLACWSRWCIWNHIARQPGKCRSLKTNSYFKRFGPEIPQMYRRIVPVEELINWKKLLNFAALIYQAAPRKFPDLSTYPFSIENTWWRHVKRRQFAQSIGNIGNFSYITVRNFVSFPNFLQIRSDE
jgi:hypothetical protein